MPTNLEVAIEIDKIAEEIEGPSRQERLVKMRKEALRIMKLLKKCEPLLVGSVWRGTIHRSSDLDVIVHDEEPKDILKTLEQTDLKVVRSEWVNVTKHGKVKSVFHIYAESPIKEEVEIVVHNPEEPCLTEKCEIYGDKIAGLHLEELERVLQKNPTQRFVPFES